MVKNPPANAGDARHMGSVTGSGRSPGEGNGSSLQFLAWRIPWTEEPGELPSMGLQESDMADVCGVCNVPSNVKKRRKPDEGEQGCVSRYCDLG